MFKLYKKKEKHNFFLRSILNISDENEQTNDIVDRLVALDDRLTVKKNKNKKEEALTLTTIGDIFQRFQIFYGHSSHFISVIYSQMAAPFKK